MRFQRMAGYKRLDKIENKRISNELHIYNLKGTKTNFINDWKKMYFKNGRGTTSKKDFQS